MKVQPFVAVVALLQLAAAAYSAARGDWKMALANVGLSLANAVFSTMR